MQRERPNSETRFIVMRWPEHYRNIMRKSEISSRLEIGLKSNSLDIIDAQMAFFGTGCIINEQVILQDQEGVLAWVSERLAVAMRQAEDLILRDYIVSAASEINAGGGSNGFNPTNLGVTDFSLVATTLDTNNAYKFMTGIEGMDRFGKMCAEVKSSLIDLELLAA